MRKGRCLEFDGLCNQMSSFFVRLETDQPISIPGCHSGASESFCSAYSLCGFCDVSLQV